MSMHEKPHEGKPTFTMRPRLMLLAADMIGQAKGRGCNDYDLPADLNDADIKQLCELANRANFGDRPRATWPKADVETPADMRRGTADFVVMGALAFGLRLMARGAS